MIKNLYGVSLYRNAVYLMLSGALVPILGFVFWIVVARYFSSSDLGLANGLTSAIGILAMISSFGLHLGLIRFLSGEKDKRGMINSCLTISGVVCAILAVIFIRGLDVWMPKLSFLQVDLTLMVAFIIFAVMNVLYLMERNLFIAHRSTQFNLVLQITMVGSRIAVIAILFALGTTHGLSSIFLSWGIALCLVVIVGGFFIRRLQPGYWPFPAVRKQVVNDMMHFSFGNYLVELVGSALLWILPLMVLSVISAQANAYFFIAFSIAQAAYLAPTKTAIALFAEGSNEPGELRANIYRFIKITCILLPIALAILFLFGDKILLLAGREYSDNALNLLLILALAAIPLAPFELYMAIRRVQKKVKPIIYLTAFTLAFTLGASYLLISRLGVIGVGVAYSSAIGISGIVVTIIMLREFMSTSRGRLEGNL